MYRHNAMRATYGFLFVCASFVTVPIVSVTWLGSCLRRGYSNYLLELTLINNTGGGPLGIWWEKNYKGMAKRRRDHGVPRVM